MNRKDNGRYIHQIVSAIAIPLIGVIAMAGCSTNDTMYTPPPQDTFISMDTANDFSYVNTDNGFNTNTDFDYNQNDNKQTVYTDARDFSEGLSWVRISEYDVDGNWLNSQRVCINKQGQKIYELPKSTDWGDHTADFTATDFIKGVSILDENTLINNKGEVVWSVGDDGWNYADNKFGEGNTKTIKLSDGDYFSGYTFVKFYIDSFAETGIYCGVLNPDGSWRMEPIKVEDGFHSSQFFEGIRYDFITQDENGYYQVYNTYFIEENRVEESKSEDIPTIEEAKSYKSSRNKYYCDRHDGLMYSNDSVGFEDFSNKVVLDLSRYARIEYSINDYTGYPDYPVFNDGYAVLDVYNQDKSKYMTVIDKKGEQLFEPIKCEDHDNVVSDDLLLVEYENNEQVFLNMKGETEIVVDGMANTFCEGYAIIKSRDSQLDIDVYHYIDTHGNVVI